MQQRSTSVHEIHTDQASTQQQEEQWSKRGFIRLERATQLQAFFAWLPKEIHDAPGIDWTQLSPEIMRYCVQTLQHSPDAAALALAAASMIGTISLGSQLANVKRVSTLLRKLRATGVMQRLTDLKQEQAWYEWAKDQDKAKAACLLVRSYTAITKGHFPRYLLRLDLADRQRMQQYALPLPPADLTNRYFPMKQRKAVQATERKATTDVLTPLYPVLRQLVRFRKQLAERTLVAYREACHKVESGKAILPYHFQHRDAIPEVNRDAQSIAEVKIQGREVMMHFILWDKRTWIQHHPDRYSEERVRSAKVGIAAYSSEQNCFFVQFDGPPSDCLWFGDILDHRLLRRFGKDGFYKEGQQEQSALARQFGFSYGCCCKRSGLLSPGDRWFSLAAERGNELIFDLESLYRGILFGAALAMIALSNGSRMSELLQVSWNKERRITRTETVVVLGEDGQPILGC